MEESEQNILTPILDVIIGLWRRSDRDFDKKGARRAFRETCYALLRGDCLNVPEPDEDCPRDSPEWARYVAACDCKGVCALIEGISLTLDRNADTYSCESDDETDEWKVESDGRLKRTHRQRIDPMTDRRFKSNKSAEQIEKMQRNLAYARSKAMEISKANNGETLPWHDSSKSEDSSEYIETKKEEQDIPQVEYQEKRPKNSRPNIVPIPPLPTDYRMENEWVKKNIKSPDMLYTYVRKKSGDGVRWSSGMRKYFENNDFWEFAFDTLSSGGWHDSEHNRPINNVSKYITKVTIEEFSRHEATKHSRFEGKFSSGKDLLEYLETHCYGLGAQYQTEDYCEWFLQRMNDVGWRWNNGATINNLPSQMTKLYEEYLNWRNENERNLVGLNPDQIGDVSKVHRAIERGEWKPRANGKFSAMDLKGLL